MLDVEKQRVSQFQASVAERERLLTQKEVLSLPFLPSPPDVVAGHPSTIDTADTTISTNGRRIGGKHHTATPEVAMVPFQVEAN